MKKSLLFVLIFCFLAPATLFSQAGNGSASKELKAKIKLDKHPVTALRYYRNLGYCPVNAYESQVVLLDSNEMQALQRKIKDVPPDSVIVILDGPYDAWCSNGINVMGRVDTAWEKIWFLDSARTLIYRERLFSKLEFGKVEQGDLNKRYIGGDQFTLNAKEGVYRFQINEAGRLLFLGKETKDRHYEHINFIGHDCTSKVSFNRWFNIGLKRRLLNHLKGSILSALTAP